MKTAQNQLRLVGEVRRNGQSLYLKLDKDLRHHKAIQEGDRIIYDLKEVIPGLRRQHSAIKEINAEIPMRTPDFATEAGMVARITA